MKISLSSMINMLIGGLCFEVFLKLFPGFETSG
jgi:hypothetical protein